MRHGKLRDHNPGRPVAVLSLPRPGVGMVVSACLIF